MIIYCLSYIIFLMLLTIRLFYSFVIIIARWGEYYYYYYMRCCEFKTLVRVLLLRDYWECELAKLIASASISSTRKTNDDDDECCIRIYSCESIVRACVLACTLLWLYILLYTYAAAATRSTFIHVALLILLQAKTAIYSLYRRAISFDGMHNV